MIYLLTYIYTSINVFINSKKIYYFLTFPIFIIIFGLRYQVGADWYAYERAFYDIGNDKFDIGYRLLSKLIYFIFHNYSFLILFIFIFYAYSYFKNIEYFTPNYNLGIIAWMGISFLSFGVLRQSISIAIFFFSLRYINDHKGKYILLICIASLFHISAIFLLPLLLLGAKEISIKKIILVLIGAFIFYKFNLIRYILPVMTKVPIIGRKIMWYISSNGAIGSPIGLDIRFFEAIILLIICVIFKEKLKEEHKHFNLFFNMLVYYIVIYLVFNSIYSIGIRFSQYFQLAHIILFSYLISVTGNKYLKINVISLLIYYCFIRYFKILISGNEMYLYFFPYKNIILEMVKNNKLY